MGCSSLLRNPDCILMRQVRHNICCLRLHCDRELLYRQLLNDILSNQWKGQLEWLIKCIIEVNQVLFDTQKLWTPMSYYTLYQVHIWNKWSAKRTRLAYDKTLFHWNDFEVVSSEKKSDIMLLEIYLKAFSKQIKQYYIYSTFTVSEFKLHLKIAVLRATCTEARSSAAAQVKFLPVALPCMSSPFSPLPWLSYQNKG